MADNTRMNTMETAIFILTATLQAIREEAARDRSEDRARMERIEAQLSSWQLGNASSGGRNSPGSSTVTSNPPFQVMGEVVGTFILMFCVCGIIASTQHQNGAVGLLEYAATAGLTVVVIIFSIGPISCAHVNPAITVAFATIGQFPWSKVPIYIIAQTIGSLMATYIGSLVYGIKSEVMMTQPLQGCNSAFWVEVIATFIIMFLVTALTSESQSVGHLSGFVTGIAIGLAVLITGPVSGGSMNPARSLGPAIVSWKFKNIWIYILAPSGGAVAGALMFRFLRLKDQHCSSPNTSEVGIPYLFVQGEVGP